MTYRDDWTIPKSDFETLSDALDNRGVAYYPAPVWEFYPGKLIFLQHEVSRTTKLHTFAGRLVKIYPFAYGLVSLVGAD